MLEAIPPPTDNRLNRREETETSSGVELQLEVN